MTNLNVLHESELPAKERKLRELVRKIREVTAEIEYAGKGDTVNLAQVLDSRQISALKNGYFDRPGKWLTKTRHGKRSSDKLRRFLKQYLPDLWEPGSKPIKEITAAAASPHVSKNHVSKQMANADRERAINGWSIRQDRHGYFRAYKRVGGKVRSIYLGKNLAGAAEKLACALSNEPDANLKEYHQ